MSVGAFFALGLMIGLLRARLEAAAALLGAAARTDSLTGLPNRRAFDEGLATELERARRDDAPLGLVLVDLDHFKRVNDEHGHEAGDHALRRVAGVLRTATRPFDTSARLGGEEFVLLVPGADGEAAAELAERVRAEVAGHFGHGPVRLTTSCGVASHPRHGETPGALLRAADEALYLAKERGRDRVVVASSTVHDRPADRRRLASYT